MATPSSPLAQPPAAGLCDSCLHQRLVRTTRASTFSLCARSRDEPSYPRYPRLPVTSCAGHERRPPEMPAPRPGAEDR